MTLPSARPKIPHRSLLFLVPFLGLVYDSICHVYAFVFYFLQTPSFAIFIIIPLVGALAVWRGGRLGYIISTAISAQFFLVEGPFGLAGPAWGAVTVTDYFLIYITVVPALFLALLYSLIGLKQVFSKPGIPQKPSRVIPTSIPTSSLFVLVAFGFILGGVTIGLIAAQTELALARGTGVVAADITILNGAGNSNNPQFYSPSSFTVKAGTAVTWVNHDGMTHTVTSANGLFDSGPLPPGASFSHTFTQPGTYQYTCTYHPWMTGTIIVT